MLANYHTHTFRCGHAAGTEREYIENAIAGGIKLLGFSDHCPYRLPGLHPGVRMAPEELRDYVAVLNALREEYCGRIELRIGLEAEYYPAGFDGLLEQVHCEGIEYLILGQHYLGNEEGEVYCGRPTDAPQTLRRYVEQSIRAMDTGKFTYFAHPDLIHFTGREDEYLRAAEQLCRAAKERAVPLEINLLGLRTGRNYPDERFWRVAGEVGNTAVIGCDAHFPDTVWVPEAEAAARAMAERCGLKILERVELQLP